MYPTDFINVVGGSPGRIRTCDPLIRSQILYPAELQAPKQPGIYINLLSGIQEFFLRSFIFFSDGSLFEELPIVLISQGEINGTPLGGADPFVPALSMQTSFTHASLRFWRDIHLPTVYVASPV